MRRAFTLIELLVVIAVIALMATVAVLNVSSGRRNARLKGAARNVFAVIRNARSRALVTQIPVVVTYDNEKDGEELSARITVDSKKLFTRSGAPVGTLSGYPLPVEAAETLATEAEPVAEGGSEEGDAFDLSYEVVRGICVKAEIEEDPLVGSSAGAKGSRISVFSTADYLKKKFSSGDGAGKKTSVPEAAGKEPSGSLDAVKEKPEPVSVVWQTNGRTDPHRVWVYAYDSNPESGIAIVVDRFGAARTPEDGEHE